VRTGLRACVLATGNAHKLAELSAMLQDAGVALDVLPPRSFGEPPEIVEDGETFTANAEKKARGLAAWLRERGVAGDTLVLADDSGICIDALDGAPGVTSARWAGEPCDDAANNRKLVHELEQRGLDRSPAHYVCVLALVRVDGAPIDARVDGDADVACFEGAWDVEVRTAARGDGGFGYDPHAWLEANTEGGPRTVAELSAGDKAARSHRGAALRALVRWWTSRAS
jgi:XTP/dITP diphosphohydrolase